MSNQKGVFQLNRSFNEIEEDKSWSFEEIKRKETSYLTHSYHRYPAKFIPQLARRCILEYSKENDLIVDPFCGSGTTLVESLIYKRRSLGVDINPVAILISKAKLTPILPEKLEFTFQNLLTKIEELKINRLDFNERIKYWFPSEEIRLKLFNILEEINSLKEDNLKTFFLCGFSQILKNCSIWLAKSNKPTRDFKKIIPDPYKVFHRQIKSMIKKNEEFYALIKNNSTIINNSAIFADARNIPLEKESVKLIVTSPPYVTSYEYADLHQLTALWLKYSNSLSEFRNGFIGSIQKNNLNYTNIKSEIAIEILKKLGKESKAISSYFLDMQQCFEEMYRILQNKGLACIVIGNTKIKGIDILNAEIFVEIMNNIGFKTDKIIKRAVPSKILPQTRDSKTGRFAKTHESDRLSYNNEYIIIMEK